MNGTDITAITTILSAIVGIVFVGLIWLIKKQFDQASSQSRRSDKLLEDGNRVYTKLGDSIEKLTKATQQQSESLTARDKRDHDFQKEVMASFKNIIATQDTIIATQDRNYKAVLNQKIAVQTVENQIVKGDVKE